MAVPGFIGARRSGNHASAVASLRAISSAQRAFATSCGFGNFATALTDLGTAPPSGGEAFISPDLGVADIAIKSGYEIKCRRAAMAPRRKHGRLQRRCRRPDLSSTFYATAAPLKAGPASTISGWASQAPSSRTLVAIPDDQRDCLHDPGGQPIQ